jgi:hypothetical protein
MHNRIHGVKNIFQLIAFIKKHSPAEWMRSFKDPSGKNVQKSPPPTVVEMKNP